MKGLVDQGHLEQAKAPRLPGRNITPGAPSLFQPVAAAIAWLAAFHAYHLKHEFFPLA